MSKKHSVITLICSVCLLLFFVFFFCRVTRDENQKFEDYTSALFRQEVSSGTISLHYTLKEPEKYGITHAPVSLGSVACDADAVRAAAENALALLYSHDRGKLSEANKQTYDVLEAYFSSCLAEGKYILYEEPLAPLTGTQSQLPVILSEYRFYDVEDCDTYLDLLTKIPEYFRSIIAFEQAKSDAGLFMANYSADALIEECSAFVEMGSANYLYSSFEERLSTLGLPEETAASYIEINCRAIEAYVFPAYQELIQALTELKGTGKNTGGLCHLPDGDEYYALTVASQTGSSRTIPELQALALAQIAEDSTALQQVLASAADASSPNPSSDAGSSSLTDLLALEQTFPDSSPGDILRDLEEGIRGVFPAPPAVNTNVKYVQESMEDYLSPAFYMIPAIDDTENNVIYINEEHMPDGLTLFTTLAHEGYPGHLYQTVYYSSTNPDPIRSLLSFGGYTEGWATYGEMMSYYLAPLSKEQATLMQRNSSIILGLYALADMGIHYDGWSLLDTISFFRDYGITDNETIEEIYELIVADPGNYLKYYIGYVELLELKKDAMEEWGDKFTQERFHREVLEIGPAPFEILRKYMLGTYTF